MGDLVQDIDCHAAMTQLWDYLDGELTARRMAEVRAHLAACSQCLPHGEFGQRFLHALGAQREAGGLPGALRARVLKDLAAAGFTGGLT